MSGSLCWLRYDFTMCEPPDNFLTGRYGQHKQQKTGTWLKVNR